MQYLLLLFLLTHCSSVFSSSGELSVQEIQSLGLASRKNLSLSKISTDDPKRSCDHLKTERERYEKYHCSGNQNSVSDKMFLGRLLSCELEAVDGNPELFVLGYEDIAKGLQTACLCCYTCLPKDCVECPANSYVELTQLTIDSHLENFNRTISAQERS